MAKGTAELLIKIKDAGAKSLNKVRDGIKSIASVATAAGAAIVAFVGASVAKFRTQELAVNKLNQSLVQQGIFTSELSQKYQENAAALQKLTTFGDEAIISAQAQLQAYLGQQEVTQELTKATLDFASAMGVDLKTASDLIGKTVGSSTNALSRYGISVDSSASKSEKLEQVIKAMNDRFGGQAEAAAKGLGSLEQMKNAFGDFMEVVGERVAPLVTLLAKKFTLFAESAQKDSSVLSGIADVFKFIVKTGLGVKFVFQQVGAALGIFAATVFETIPKLVTLQFEEATRAASDGAQLMGAVMAENKRQLNQDLAEIDALEREQTATNEQEKTNLLLASQLRNAQIKQEARTKELTEEQKHQASLLGIQLKAGTTSLKAQQQIDSEKEKARSESLSTISSLQSSNNKALAAIGKAAALTQIAIQAPIGVSRALAAFPPPFNFVAAGAVGAAFAAQAAKVSGIALAEGGIVQPRSGGVQATIGEAGQQEAVIPLDDDGASGMMGGNTFIFNGPVMGDEDQARQQALFMDAELRKLRQNNESQAFDERLT